MREPKKNKFFAELRELDPEENEIVKIDCGDEFSGVLTKGGKLYVWGKNDRGQLGTGIGVGIEYTESVKIPLKVAINEEIFISDFTCGENIMIFKDSHGNLYRTGFKIDYTPSLIDSIENIKPKLFLCGKSYYCVISGKNEFNLRKQ